MASDHTRGQGDLTDEAGDIQATQPHSIAVVTVAVICHSSIYSEYSFQSPSSLFT